MAHDTSSSPARSAPAASPRVEPGLRGEYEASRERLERLMAAPVKDFPAIDELVDRLEMLQLAIKEEHGIKGNNPNE